MWRGVRCLQRCLIANRHAVVRLCKPKVSWQCMRPPCLTRLKSSISYGQRWAKLAPKASATYGEVPSDGGAWEEVEVELPSHCAGCGVTLQLEDPEAPGFFQVPKKLIDQLSAPPEEEEEELHGEQADGSGEAGPSGRDADAPWRVFDSMVESWEEEPSERRRVQVRSFLDVEAEEGLAGDVLCARCYSLRHYGRVKSAGAEASLPAFDFERQIGRRIALQKFRRSVVLVVVDLADFDGSLPRAAVRSLLPPEQRSGGSVAERLPFGFRLVVAANKADLLPRQATHKRLEAWARRRMAQGGLPRASAVHVVSSERGTGVKELLADLQAAAGTRGDVFVVGAQNAGKSSLINAMRRAAGLPAGRHVTSAVVAGTTLGIVSVPSLLPKGCMMLDTPGVPHSFQLASYMTADEMRMLLPKRPLKPRTYRIGEGQSVSLGAVARVDVLQAPGATLYLTVWASDEVVGHMGKTEGAAERYAKHAGTRLAPPCGDEERMQSFPALVPTDVEVTGDSWRQSSMDVAVAGLGWVAVGLAGAAALRVWAPPGVAITTRDALLLDYASELERPGFSQQAVTAKQGGDSRQGGRGGAGRRAAGASA